LRCGELEEDLLEVGLLGGGALSGEQVAQRAGIGAARPHGALVRSARSARVAWVTSRPLAMITTWSTVWATSASTWLETSTV
jgi:hypothetical protein